MVIVDRKTFLKYPPGTVFAKYEPCAFEGLQIKGETSYPNDFFCYELVDAIECEGSEDSFHKLTLAQETGCSLPMDFYRLSRDGSFNDTQMFAVFERTDVEALIARLNYALTYYK